MHKLKSIFIVSVLTVIAFVSLSAHGFAEITTQPEITGPSVQTVPQSSGFVDQDGNPVSKEELDRAYKESTGIQWKNIIHDTVILLIIVVIAGSLYYMYRKKRKANSAISQSVAANYVAQPPTQPTNTNPNNPPPQPPTNNIPGPPSSN